MTQIDAIEDRRKDAALALLHNAKPLIAQALAQNTQQPDALRRLICLARQAGLHTEAELLLKHLVAAAPDDMLARATLALFRKEPSISINPNLSAPASFVRLTDFLPEQDHARALGRVIETLPRFSAGKILREDAGLVDPAFRRTSVLNNAKEFQDLIIEPIKNALLGFAVPAVLGVSLEAGFRFELQASCYGDGAFFRTHVDNTHGAARTRLISFVYYLHTQPRRFDGGDLLLLDGGVSGAAQTPYTRIRPDTNSVILFRSDALHEVEPVIAKSALAQDGRLSINGWIHQRSETYA